MTALVSKNNTSRVKKYRVVGIFVRRLHGVPTTLNETFSFCRSGDRSKRTLHIVQKIIDLRKKATYPKEKNDCIFLVLKTCRDEGLNIQDSLFHEKSQGCFVWGVLTYIRLSKKSGSIQTQDICFVG